MDVDGVTFNCGTKVTVDTLFCHYSQQSGRATGQIMDHFIGRNLEQAEEIVNTKVMLISPVLTTKPDGYLDFPAYWCVIRFTAIHPERDYRHCGVQWYQDTLLANPLSYIIEWAATRIWRNVVDEALRKTT